MLVMPILNTSKNGISKIYNVEVTLKTAAKVKKDTKLRGFSESDIIINGTSFNDSVYNIKNKQPNVIVNFLRNNNFRANKKDFLITTRENSNSNLFDLYNVDMPPRKITAGLDNLYGSVVIDMQKEIPNIKHGRYIDLEKLGVSDHITSDKIDKLKNVIQNKKINTNEELNYLLQANGISDLKSTLDFMNLFDFKIIDESIIKEEDMNNMIASFNNTYSKDFKSLKKYKKIASHNKDVYGKVTYLNQLIYGKPINLIHKAEKEKIKVYKNDAI